MGRPQSQKPLWINEKVTPQITIGDKTYQVGQHQYPHNETAEKDILGGLFALGEVGKANDAIKTIPFLRYDDFYYMRHAYIWRAMERLYLSEQQVDISGVVTELEKRKLLEMVGGQKYLLELSLRTAVNIRTYAERIVLEALNRATMVAGNVLIEIGAGRRLEIKEFAAELQKAIQDIAIRSQTLTHQNTISIYDALNAYVQSVEEDVENEDYEPGVTTGFTWLDDLLLGWRKRKMYVVAGPSGMGKSAFLGCAALNALHAGKRVLFISTEMERQEILDRFICAEGKIDGTRFQARKLNKAEIQRMREAKDRLQSAEKSQAFMIICMSQPTMREIRSKLDELQFNPGFDVIFLDYAGWNTISDGGKFKGNTIAHTGHIFTDLKEIAKGYDIPVVTGCQINRNYAERKDKRPLMTDLSDSGLSEKSADVVMFIHRDAVFQKMPEFPTRAEAIVVKNRSGKGGKVSTVYLNYEAEFTLFSDWKLPTQGGKRKDIE